MSATETTVARTSLPPLYETETNLVAFFDSEANVTPELEAEFRAELAAAMAVAVKKRDAVAGFILECENRADFAAAEIKRLQGRKNVFLNWAERLRAYVCAIIEQLPTDAKGKPAKLVGERFTMSARAVPSSLEITDAEAVPLTFKTVTVTMPALEYEVIKQALLNAAEAYQEEYGGIDLRVYPAPASFDFSKLPAHYSIDNAAVKAALQKGEAIPGADLRVGGMTLVVR